MTAEDQHWQTFRNGFPSAGHRIYLDTSSHGLKSTAVQQAFQAYLQSWQCEAPWESTWQEETEACLHAFSRLIAAPDTSVALMASLTAAFQAVLYSLEWTPERNEVVMSAREWVSLQHVVRAHPSARPIFVPAEHHPDSNVFLDHVSDRTRLVVVSHVCYQTGYRTDLRMVAEAAHASGASCFVDAYQSLGVTDLNVAESGTDFVATGALKFLLGVPGVAFLYVQPEQREQLTPSLSGWRGQVEPMNPKLNPSPGAKGFTGGTWPVPSVYGARAGMELLLATGPKLIAERVEQLTTHLLDGLFSLDLQPLTPCGPAHRAGVISVRCPNPAWVQSRLRDAGVVCSQRGEGLRFSLHAYNTHAEVEEAVSRLGLAMADNPAGIINGRD